mgnify:CR=1 FL=1|jgi:hypothetical protein
MADEQKTEIENTESLETKQEEPQEKLLTQEEFDNAFKNRLARERRKLEKMFEGIDPDEARKLKEEKEKRELEMKKERGEFETVLKETVSKKDAIIAQQKAELKAVRIDDELLKEASNQQAIKPQQVVNLLKNKVQLSEDGKAEIIGDNNLPIFNDKAEPMSIKEYVEQFLNDNPHFKVASPSGAGSKSSVGGDTPKPLNLAELNMNNPEDKARYMEYRKEKFKNY